MAVSELNEAISVLVQYEIAIIYFMVLIAELCA